MNGTTLDNSQQQNFARRYSRAAGDVDSQISRVLSALSDAGKLDNTVVIITAAHGMPLNPRAVSLTGPGAAAGAAGYSLAVNSGAEHRDADQQQRCDDHADAAPAARLHACQRIFAG